VGSGLAGSGEIAKGVEVAGSEGRVGLGEVGVSDDAGVAVTTFSVSDCEVQETNNAPARVNVSDVCKRRFI